MEALAERRGLRFCGPAFDGALRVAVAGGLSDLEAESLRQAGLRVRRAGDRTPADLEVEVAAGAGSGRRFGALLAATRRWFRDRAVVGGVLVGGASRRMGRDKALLPWGQRRWIDRQVETAALVASEVILAGRAIAPYVGVPDGNGVGPLAGVWALAQVRPTSTLLILAVDQPLLDQAALSWLRRQRRIGVDVVLPALDGRLAPLPLVIEPQAFPALGRLAESGRGPRALLEVATASHPAVPARFRRAWRDFDTEEALATLPTGSPVRR